MNRRQTKKQLKKLLQYSQRAVAEPQEMQRDITTRAFSTRAASIDEETRSVEAVMATEAPAVVMDWKNYRLIDEVLSMRGVQLPEQIVMLDSHMRWSNDDVIGSARGFRIDGDKLIARAYFVDGDENVERHWNKVRQGHITDFSAGYRVDEYTDIPPGETRTVQGRDYKAGDRTLRITTKWTLREVSLVPIGADEFAKVRQEQTEQVSAGRKTPMENEVKEQDEQRTAPPATPPAPPAPKQVDEGAVRDAAVQAERDRVRSIRALAVPGIDAALIERAVDEGWPKEKASEEFLRSLRESAPPSVGHVEVGVSRAQDAARDIANGICLRIGVQPEDPKQLEAARAFQGIGLRDAARAALEAEGQRAPVNSDELFKRAISTNTFATLLSNTANKSLHKGYTERTGTFMRWAGRRSVSDFKTYTDIKLGNFGTMPEVGDGGELKHAGLTDSSETYNATTYGLRFGVTRKTWINDDLGALMQVPMKLGAAAARNMDDTAYALLTSASGLGPTMNEDSLAMFSASHTDGSNYSSTTATDGMTDAGMTMARKLMRKIKNGNEQLNLSPRWLLVPPEQEDAALRLMTSRAILLQNTNSSTREVLGENNIHQGLAEIIVEPRLSTATDGDTAWYLITDAMQAESLVAVFLNGRTEPYLERHDPSDVLGIGWQIYFDFGVAAVDWRGIVKSKGD